MPTINKRGNSYQIIVSCGYDSKGKHLRRSMTWTPSPNMTERQIEKELNRQATLFEERVHSGSFISGAVKLETFAEQWLKSHAEKNLKKSTIDRYRRLTGRLYQALGAKRIDKITVANVQAFIDNLSEPGIKQHNVGKNTPKDELPPPAGLSPKTIRHYHSLLSAILEHAVNLEMIQSNPCRKVKLPPLKTPEKDIYTLEEAAHFMELLEGENWQYRAFFTLAIYTGLRRGELLGLQWSDIDFNNATLSVVRNSLYSARDGMYDDTPKTKQSERVLPMPAPVVSMLTEYKAWQDERREELGDQWINSDRLFTRWNGQPMFADTPYTWLERFCQRNGLRKMGIHSFRHLNATLLIDAGVDVKTTSALLGHSNTSTTMNIYAHALDTAKARAVGAVADVLTFGSPKKEKPPSEESGN